MLVLTRKQGEAVLIGEGVKLSVIAVDGQRVRFGITAPPNVHVLRGELAERESKKKQNRLD